jgi:hypothetical protein
VSLSPGWILPAWNQLLLSHLKWLLQPKSCESFSIFGNLHKRIPNPHT